ncbi:MFS transporter [Aureibacter tunicatorum]|uniref:MFS family permease n=1 Tax=Aureibacter tunicatorum TaxID=866807 RepID=A0AAE3XJT4_9BACT|nr:MFS transporter [Aureibacter tunicatorum]MDR6237308.1 MFS family permease [Aureibacter tunicatorum]BDD06299.1 MFS transporter [Aureibacter tunicatorum]
MNLNYWKLLEKYPNYIGFGALHYFYSSFGQTFLISLFVPNVLESFQLDNAEFSYFYSGATLLGAVGIAHFGPYADKMDIRKFSIINGLGLAIFCLLMANTFNKWTLCAALIGVRLTGQGLMPLIGATSMGRFFSQNRGKALSLSSSSMSLAEMVTPYIVFLMIQSLGWKYTWMAFSVFIAFTFIPAVYKVVEGHDEFRLPKQNKNKNLVGTSITKKELFSDYRFITLALIIIFCPFVTTGVFIHQNLILQAKGWDEAWFAFTFVGFGTFRICTTFFAGPIIDKFSAGKLVVFILFPVISGLLIMDWIDHKFALFYYMCMNGMTLSFGSLVGSALWAEIYGGEHLGKVKSTVSTMMIFATAISPVIFGIIFENHFNTRIGISILSLLGITLAIIGQVSLKSIKPATHKA